MLFYVIDENLNIIDVVENVKSWIWTTRFQASGDFELYVPASRQMLEVLRRDRYLARETDLSDAMIIQNIQLDTDFENGDFLIVKGKSLSSILSRRIVWEQTVLNDYADKAIRTLVKNNAISSTSRARNFSQLTTDTGINTIVYKGQFTGDTLEEAIQAICKYAGFGYKIELDLESKKFRFKTYQGADRSYNQSTNPRVIFSNEFENLLRTTYSNNFDNFKNVAKVAGEGEGTARKSVEIYNTTNVPAGLGRYELFVDARDVSSNDGEIAALDYENLLSEKGLEALEETKITETIEGEVEANYTYKFNEDYFLGDVVEVVNEYGITMTPQILEVIESEDESGHYTIPSFGTN